MRKVMFVAPVLFAGAGMLAPVQFASAQASGTQPSRGSGDAMGDLHTALRLNAQQEVAWNTYRAATSLTQQGQARRNAASRLFPNLDAPHRMDLVEAEVRQELADIHNQSVALKDFYATLTPEQRRTFDQRTLPSQNGATQRR